MGNQHFTYVIDIINVILMFLLLPMVNKLGEKSFCDVMNQFPKNEGWVTLTTLHSSYQFRFWWI